MFTVLFVDVVAVVAEEEEEEVEVVLGLMLVIVLVHSNQGRPKAPEANAASVFFVRRVLISSFGV